MIEMKNKQIKYEKALEYEIFVKGEYSFAEEKILGAKCIFDIWWHIWLFSQWCRSLNSEAKIYYFEPIKEFYDKAESELWSDKNIILNNLWISSNSWNWILLFNEEKTMQSSKYSSFLNRNWKEVVVEFTTFRDYLKENGIDNVDVLKMDVEWMEFEILSSRWDFERWRIDNFISEIHILNDGMKSEWNQIFLKIKNIFWNVKIIESWYCEEVFLVWAFK